MKYFRLYGIFAYMDHFSRDKRVPCIRTRVYLALGLVGFDLSVPPFAQHCEIPICQNRMVEQPESKSTQPNSQTTCPTLRLLGRAVKCRPPCQMNAASGLELWHVTTHCVPRKKDACHSLLVVPSPFVFRRLRCILSVF